MSAFNKYRLVFGVVCMILAVLNWLSGISETTNGMTEELLYSIIGTVLWFAGAYVVIDCLNDD